MLLGINYPWLHYGWDFGEPPAGWQPRAHWTRVIDSHLDELARVGITVVRWFVIADGLLYGTGPDAPVASGIFSPPAVSGDVLEDFERLLWTMRRHEGMKLIPVLLDFHFGFPAEIPTGTTGYVKGGRSGALTDPAGRRRLINQLLIPFLEVSARYRPQIYAWDLINEPEGITDTGGPGRGERPTVPLAAMVEFLTLGVETIRRYRFLATIGYRRPGTAPQWARPPMSSARPAGEDMWQFHYYARRGISFPSRSDIRREGDVILGEFATWPARDEWPGLTDQTVAARLAFAEDQGIALAMPWSFRAQMRAAGLWTGQAAQREALAQYGGGGESAAEPDWTALAEQIDAYRSGVSR